jgi:hypothetical protein
MYFLRKVLEQRICRRWGWWWVDVEGSAKAEVSAMQNNTLSLEFAKIS